MKIITCFSVIIAVVCAVKQEVHILSPDQQSALKIIGLQCAQEFNVDPINIRKLGDNTIPRDAATNKFLHCFGVKAGFVDTNGHIVVERVASVIKDHPRIEEFKAVITKCSQITKENPVETTVANHQCYSENAPVLYGYLP